MLDRTICGKCWNLDRSLYEEAAGWECRASGVSYVRAEESIPAKCRYFFEQCVSAGVTKKSKEEKC